MKDKRFDGIMIPLDAVSPGFVQVISLVADEEYAESFDWINEYISQTENEGSKSIAAMMTLQTLALMGYKEIALVLLKALLKNFESHSKAENLCQRTINNLY